MADIINEGIINNVKYDLLDISKYFRYFK